MAMGRRWIWRSVAAVVVLLLVAAAWGAWQLRSMGFLRSPVFETARPQLPELQHPAVLVFSKTNAFIHREAIPAAKELLQQLVQGDGGSVFLTDEGGVFNAGDLARFDVVVWNSVTGDVLLPEQRAAFRDWLEQGGGFVGLHAAGDDSHAVWPWYQDSVIRARFIGHPLDPQFQQASVRIAAPGDPLLAALPSPWLRTDEWYSFDASPRARGVRVLLALDESSYAPGEFFGKPLAMGDDHAVAWAHCVGRGRVFYSALGHTAESYAEPGYRELLRRALAWAGDAGPRSDGALDCTAADAAR